MYFALFVLKFRNEGVGNGLRVTGFELWGLLGGDDGFARCGFARCGVRGARCEVRGAGSEQRLLFCCGEKESAQVANLREQGGIAALQR